MTLAHEPTLISLPGLIQLQSYGAAASITGSLVESLATFVKNTTGEELTHTIRKTFPEPLDRSLAAEAERAWAPPKNLLRLSNKLSSANHIQVSAGTRPRRTERGRELYGFVAVYAKTGSSACSALAEAFSAFCDTCQPVFARIDSPTWGQETSSESAFPTAALLVAPEWLLRERLAWKFYLSAHTLNNLPTGALSGFTANGGTIYDACNAGAILKVSEYPLRDSSPSDVALLAAAAKSLDSREGVL